VEFFPSQKEAIFAGYRACLRCRPMESAGAHPREIRRVLLELERHPEGRLKDAELRALGVPPEKLRRYFLRRFGMTFQSYARGRRLTDAFQKIKRGGGARGAAHEHGFESESGFRDAFKRLFGETPGRARDASCLLVTWVESPLGPLVAGATDSGLALLEFSDRRMLETQFKNVRRAIGMPLAAGSNAHLERAREELARYFDGKLRSFSVPLAAPGTPFQERVWRALLKIPYGETRSYEEIARQIGSPGAMRAVGTANGMNRICIVIPCHRVVNASGALGGYGGGLWRKHWLLRLEGSAASLRTPA
jgi:AraC family transcriptional regulator of adaptative response/methylated-DNA-[protein]-cysteine methyltransferase